MVIIATNYSVKCTLGYLSMEISSAFSAIKTISELAKLMIEAKTDEKAKEVAIQLQNSVISLQNIILTLQSEHSDLLDSNHELQDQIAAISNWDEVASKYKLKELAPGVFVYALAENDPREKLNYYICTKCYQDSKISILQASEATRKGTNYSCPSCGTVITDYQSKAPPRKHVRRTSSSSW